MSDEPFGLGSASTHGGWSTQEELADEFGSLRPGHWTEGDFALNDKTYAWSARVFSLFRRMLKVQIHWHRQPGQIEQGDIFVFNHFARFETFIPQYLIYQEIGAHCRSVAAGEFFVPDQALTRFLLEVGAVPSSYPDLLPFLAKEILRGRKVVIFPEGGMVKDRRVVDEQGEHSVFSRSAQARRKSHTGAAVLALMLDAFKMSVMRLKEAGDDGQLDEWAHRMAIGTRVELLRAASKPTAIVPGNITFYPLRVDDNLLSQAVEIISRGGSTRLLEEALVEGNILLRDTDMDIRLGATIQPRDSWRWWERHLVNEFGRASDGIEYFFRTGKLPRRFVDRVAAKRLGTRVEQLRDTYMQAVYREVTVHYGHVLASVVRACARRSIERVAKQTLHLVLYDVVKHLQRTPGLSLHETLTEPDRYAGNDAMAFDSPSPAMSDVREVPGSHALLELEDASYHIDPAILSESDFDNVRVSNPWAVYANEVEPVGALEVAVDVALGRHLGDAEKSDIAAVWAAQACAAFDDELRRFELDRVRFTQPEHEEVNSEQTMTADPRPFVEAPRPDGAPGDAPSGTPSGTPCGTRGAAYGSVEFFHRVAESNDPPLVLVHGLLASPAEMNPLARHFSGRGHPVLGVRLRGHGTSPWDLRTRTRADWLRSVRRAVSMTSGPEQRPWLIGFSTGGALALKIAAEMPECVAGVVTICAPVTFHSRAMSLVPWVHRANALWSRIAPTDGLMTFADNDPEHPEINYRHIPVSALNELRVLIDETLDSLSDVSCPVMVSQSRNDPVVEPESATRLVAELPPSSTRLEWIEADIHGVAMADADDLYARIGAFIDASSARSGEHRQAPPPE